MDHYKRYAPSQQIDELSMCGGGALNPNIEAHIQSAFPDMKILQLGDAGIDGGVKEAITFAWQGMEAVSDSDLYIP